MDQSSPVRGQLRRGDKALDAAAISALLATTFCGRTATIGADGFPYVVPNLFVWLDDQIYLHTARAAGHFWHNIHHKPQVCFEIDAPGAIFPYGPVQCDTSVAYASVIVFGTIRVVHTEAEQRSFFQALMTKYAPPGSWGRSPDALPRMGATVVYAITPESITGKHNLLPARLWQPPDDESPA